MKSDPRVKTIVDSLLQEEGVKWTVYLRRCPQGAKHVVQPSYGGREWENVGHLYEICLADANSRCNRHTMPLDRQMANATRLTMLAQLLELRPWPYNQEVYRGRTLIMRDLLEKEMVLEAERDASLRSSSVGRQARRPGTSHVDLAELPFHDTGLSSDLSSTGSSSRRSSVASSTAGSHVTSARMRIGTSLSGRPRASNASEGSAHSARGPVGRPTNPTCEVVVYIYVPGKHTPLVVHATGTPRGNLVEFFFGQGKINDALGIDASTRPRPTYLVYNHAIEDWAMYPKAHQPLFIAPDQRLLYREEYVSALPNFDYYLALVLSTDPTRPLRPQPASWTYASLRAGTRSAAPPSASSSLASSPPRMLTSPEIAQAELPRATSATAGKGKKRARSASPVPPSTRRKVVPRPDSPHTIDLTGESDNDSDDVVFVAGPAPAGPSARGRLAAVSDKRRNNGKAKEIGADEM
ncbi:hypothetical protein OH77DRAFT_1128052 [Trametes cingulata]|nr:hypothetical protein OH77DRAFT_1128052 [Trametes cingulata]